MRLRRLHLQAFGPFTDRWIDFGPGLTLAGQPCRVAEGLALLAEPFGGAFARQRPIRTAPRSSCLRKADSRKPTAALTVPLSH